MVNVLPNALLAKVANFKYKSVVLTSSCFQNVPSEFLTAIMEVLTPRYLMSNERLFNMGDMSREVCFVERGNLLVYADNEEKVFLRTVSSEGTDSKMVGEHSFFLTVAQPEMVRSMSNGDVTVLVLSKSDYFSCLEKYPECQSIIVSKVLSELGLNTKGEELSSLSDDFSSQKRKDASKDASSSNDESDNNEQNFKEHIQQILQQRSAEALYEMIVAASEGDGKKVKDLLLQGLDINTHDFDQRTTLHLAAAQGNAKVVQLLVKEGADVHAKDRWGNNPLHEAISNNHAAVGDFLARAGAELNYANPGDHMTAAAGNGDLEKLQTLISHGVDVNSSDRDGRTSLHLVSSEGNLNVVEFLLAHEANPNSKDRWGHTPLDGAVEKGHDLVAAALFARGGGMNMKTAKSLFMKSARSGDLGTLKLLIENGMDIDAVDYDLCGGLHVAAMADQPVAVDFLLSNKANVNPISRWDTTPLDEAIKSQSVLSAKLLMSCGGQAFTEHNDENLKLIKDSMLTLAEARKSISTEVRLQSERRRDMHKLKQHHTKLIDDVEESNRMLKVQLNSQEHAISKVMKSRLTVDLPVFKESDLTFSNPYLELPSFQIDKRHVDRIMFDCGNNADSDKDMSVSDGGDSAGPHRRGSREYNVDKAGFSMMRFLSQQKEQEDRGAKKNPFASTSNATEGTSANVQFHSFNQVMLALPKVEEGLLSFLRCFEKRSSSYSAGGNLTLKPSELLDCVKLAGIYDVDEARIFDFVRDLHDYRFDKDHDVEDRSAELEVTFGQVVGSQYIVDLFAPEFDSSADCGKVQMAFRIIRATFNLLDTDGDGEISPEELSSSRTVVGELSYGNELFKSFDGMESVSIAEMATIFSKWTIFSDGDERETLKRYNSDDGSASELSSLSDFPELSDHKASDNGDVQQTQVNAGIDEASVKVDDGDAERSFLSSLLFLCFNREKPQNDSSMIDEVKDMLRKLSKKSFERFSREGNTFLKKDEFEKLLENLIGETSAPELKNIIQSLGIKNDAVGFDELKALLAPVEKEVNKDVDRDDARPQSKKRNYIIEPGSTLHRAIVNARLVAAMYYLAAVPYECALVHPQNLHSQSMSMLMVGWCFDLILFFDVVSKFHLAYRNEKGEKVVGLTKIRENYLAKGFVFDLVVLFPLDLMVYCTLNTRISSLGYFRVPKLLRCIDIFKYFRKKCIMATSKARLMAEIQMLFVVLFATLHASACVWFALTDPQATNKNTYLRNYQSTFSGFGSVSSSDYRVEQYLLALYWVTGTLTTMGQGGGDLMPQNAVERIFAIYLMMMNLSIYAYILGAISNLFMSADQAIVEKRAEISALERYISTNCIPLDLEREIRNATSSNSTDDNEGQGVSVEEERAVFKKLSHSLQIQVSKHTCSSLVDNVPAFRNCDKHFRESICTELTEENFGPGTFLVKRKQPCNDLYIISKGFVDITIVVDETDIESVETEVGVGGVIGEVPFFFNMRHTESARASLQSHVRVFALTREKYDRLLKVYPDEEEKIAQNILSQIDLNRNGGGKKSGTSVVSDATSSCASSADASSVHESSIGDTSSVGSRDDDDSDDGSDTGNSHAGNDQDRVDTVKRAIEARSERKALQLNYAMCLAAGKGELSVLQKAHSGGLDFDQCVYFGRTPLHIASSEGNLHVVRFLVPLMKSVNVVDSRGNTPLMDAVLHTHTDVAKYLKSVGCTLNEDLSSVQLSSACADGDSKKVDLLLQLGVNPSLNPPGRRRGAARRRRSAAHMAASNNHVDCMVLLIKHWAKLNTYDAWAGTPLADAIRHDHLQMQDVLRKAGAKLKEVGLCTAAAAGDLDTIRLMCDNGANINVTNYIGRTMLHLACSNKQPSVIEYLLSFKDINLNPIDWYGGTPLDDANRESHTSIAVMLQEAKGTSSRDESLTEDCKRMMMKRIEEKEKAVKTRATNEELDKRRAIIMEKVSSIGQIAIQDTANLRKLWDSLLLSLNSNTWKKQQAMDKSPDPSLDELLLHFRNYFATYMRRNYLLNKLRCYEVLVEFSNKLNANDVNVDSYSKVVTAIYDEYFVESSPSYVSINPDSVLEISDFMKNPPAPEKLQEMLQNKENICAKVTKEVERNLIDVSI